MSLIWCVEQRAMEGMVLVLWIRRKRLTEKYRNTTQYRSLWQIGWVWVAPTCSKLPLVTGTTTTTSPDTYIFWSITTKVRKLLCSKYKIRSGRFRSRLLGHHEEMTWWNRSSCPGVRPSWISSVNNLHFLLLVLQFSTDRFKTCWDGTRHQYAQSLGPDFSISAQGALGGAAFQTFKLLLVPQYWSDWSETWWNDMRHQSAQSLGPDFLDFRSRDSEIRVKV